MPLRCEMTVDRVVWDREEEALGIRFPSGNGLAHALIVEAAARHGRPGDLAKALDVKEVPTREAASHKRLAEELVTRQLREAGAVGPVRLVWRRHDFTRDAVLTGEADSPEGTVR